MKKLIGIFLLSFVLLLSSSCSKSTENAMLTVADTVCLREGSSINGIVVISSKDFEGFYIGHLPTNTVGITKKTRIKNSSSSEDNNLLTFKLNETGKKLFAEETKKLAGTETCLSLWVGDELISSPHVDATITDGIFVLTNTNLDAESFKTLCNKIQGK